MKSLSLVLLLVALQSLGQSVIDLGELFPQQQINHILKISEELRKQSSLKVDVLTESEKTDPDEYNKNLSQWQTESFNEDNRVLFLISTKDRSIRIKNSSSLDQQLNSEYKKNLISTYMVPSFKIGDYSTGLIQSLIDIGELYQADLFYAVPGQFAPPLRLKKDVFKNNWTIPFFLGSFILYFLWIRFIGQGPNTRFIFGAILFGVSGFLILGKLPIQIIFLSLLGGYLFWSGFSHIVPDPNNIHETGKKPIIIFAVLLLGLLIAIGTYQLIRLPSISVILGFIVSAFILNKNKVYPVKKKIQLAFPVLEKNDEETRLTHIGGSSGRW